MKEEDCLSLTQIPMTTVRPSTVTLLAPYAAPIVCPHSSEITLITGADRSPMQRLNLVTQEPDNETYHKKYFFKSKEGVCIQVPL